VLAYVFWHWKRTDIDIKEYEMRQRTFHSALADEKASGYVRSFTNGIRGVSWIGDRESAYEDWYLINDFSALDDLNRAAVASRCAGPHDRVSEFAEGGAGGIYALKLGEAVDRPRVAHWFGKPAGMSYKELFRILGPIVADAEVCVWMRQMVLGPAREFCLHSARRAELPVVLDQLVVSLRAVFPS
jgi:hypothetical protein